jgi:hypothetical protein
MCPVCLKSVKIKDMSNHFIEIHGRLPSEGEIYRARNLHSKKGGHKLTGNSIRAVSGGLPSLGKH